jgi:Arginase family
VCRAACGPRTAPPAPVRSLPGAHAGIRRRRWLSWRLAGLRATGGKCATEVSERLACLGGQVAGADEVALIVLGDLAGDTPAISISGYLGGMALAMLTGRAPELFGDALGLRPVAGTDVVLAGARDLDPAERDALTASQVRRVPADPAAITSALGGLGRTPVYLHLDVDVIDSAQLPGLRFPAGPGPSLTQIEECVAAVRTAADVTAACIACAWLPDRFSDQVTCEAITRLARALGTDLAWPVFATATLRLPPIPWGRMSLSPRCRCLRGVVMDEEPSPAGV